MSRRISRRSVLILGAGATAGFALSGPARGAESGAHGIAAFGDPKYPANFRHFDYVNPDAPKGGVVRFVHVGSYDSHNFIAPRGTPPGGFHYPYDSLLSSSYDEAASGYGLVAESVRVAPDGMFVSFRLREGVRWHDTRPLSSDDVVWTFETYRRINPGYALTFENVSQAEADGPLRVTFRFREPSPRTASLQLGRILVLPKHWWTGNDASGAPRDISAPTLDPPVGSGPYAVQSFEPGRYIIYRRVADYWGRDLPVNRGRHNFDQIHFQYYRDATVALEAFKADEYDFRIESSAKSWVTGYSFPARHQKRVVLEKFSQSSRGLMEGLVPNLRREKFQDARVRRALNLALDFEQINRMLFYGEYRRIGSYFDGTELAARGFPGPQEREILRAVHHPIPAEALTKVYANPVGGTSSRRRANLREASRLLRAAGYRQRNGRLVQERSGAPMEIEFLLNDPGHTRIVLFYKEMLSRLGIEVAIQFVDSATYLNRIRNFDFDMVIYGWIQSPTPGVELAGYFGSKSADQAATRNLAGIKNPAVDALIEQVVHADSRSRLTAAARALDRVLLWNHYVIPTWTVDQVRTARWDRFGRPKQLPKYWHGFPDFWWYDKERAAKVGIAS